MMHFLSATYSMARRQLTENGRFGFVGGGRAGQANHRSDWRTPVYASDITIIVFYRTTEERLKDHARTPSHQPAYLFVMERR